MKRKTNDNDVIVCILFAVIFIIIWVTGCFDASEQCGKINAGNAFIETAIVQYIVSAFPVVWSLSITIVLFLFGFDKVYWYGVALKDIIKLSFRKRTLTLGIITHFLLCPLMYLALNWGLKRMWLEIVVITYLIFCLIPVYVIYVLRKERITAFIERTTIQEIREQLMTDEEECQGNLQDGIEGLPITSMIKHIDYGNIEDIIALREIMLRLHTDKEKSLSLLFYKEPVGKVIYMIWSERIMRCCGMDTSAKKEQMAYILRKLWEDATGNFENIKDRKIKEDLKKLYSVEILLPFLKQNTKEAAEVFTGLWRAMLELQIKILLYLYLYMDYLYYSREVSRYIPDNIILRQISKCEIDEAAVYWDEELARRFWNGWCMLSEGGINLAGSHRKAFFQDVKHIKKGEYNAVKSHNLRRII